MNNNIEKNEWIPAVLPLKVGDEVLYWDCVICQVEEVLNSSANTPIYILKSESGNICSAAHDEDFKLRKL